jgi:hypothetical protein
VLCLLSPGTKKAAPLRKRLNGQRTSESPVHTVEGASKS